MSDTKQVTYPAGWLNPDQYHPEQNLSRARKASTKDDYLVISQRLVWFVREQRQMIASGAATCAFVIKARILELDSQAGSCTCEATIRDVLGNEATDIGTETRADFGDFPEKAATKAKGRALASLGYGTAFAPELDEGERIADAPAEHRQQSKAAPPTKLELKAGFAALGYVGTAWVEQCVQATGKSAEALAEGFTEEDRAAIAKRLHLLQDGEKRRAAAQEKQAS